MCLADTDGEIRAEMAFAHSGEGLLPCIKWLRGQTGATAEVVPVGIERPYGPVAEGSLDDGPCVYKTNRKQVDRFRDWFFAAGGQARPRARIRAGPSEGPSPLS